MSGKSFFVFLEYSETYGDPSLNEIGGKLEIVSTFLSGNIKN